MSVHNTTSNGKLSLSNLFIYVDKTGTLTSNDLKSNYPNCEIIVAKSEIQLLRTFISKLAIVDPDVYIGNNIISYFFDTLFDRILYKNIDMASKMTRLKKSFIEMKFGFKKNSKFDRLRNITAGRLVLDINESMQEFVNSVDYDLQFLAKKYFNLEINDGSNSETNLDVPN
jgi:DNA polymerase elongation subunit (family B)